MKMLETSCPLVLARYKYCLLHVEFQVPTADHNFIIIHSKMLGKIHRASKLHHICLESWVEATNVE
jgi:hypothetical protein